MRRIRRPDPLLAVVLLAWIGTAFAVCELLACPADIDGDGYATNADLTAYVDLYLAGSPRADRNGDTILDNADLAAFVAVFMEGCPVPTPVGQNYRGALSVTGTSATSYLTSTATGGNEACASDSGNAISSGDFAGGTQAWVFLRVKFPDGGSTTQDRRFAYLDDRTAAPQSLNGIFVVRSASGGIQFRLEDDAGGVFPVTINAGPGSASYDADTDYCVFYAFDNASTNIQAALGLGAGETGIGYSWTKGDSALTEGDTVTSTLGGGGTIGSTRASAEHNYVIGDSGTNGIPVIVSEFAVGDSVVGLTTADILAVCKGEKTPQALANCIRLFALDRYSSSVPSGNEVERIDLVSGSYTLDDIGAASAWTETRLGNDIDSSTDPSHGLGGDPWYGNKTTLGNYLDSGWYDILAISDSFGVDTAAQRVPHAFVCLRDSADSGNVVMWSGGFKRGDSNNTLYGTGGSYTGTGVATDDIMDDGAGFDTEYMSDEAGLAEHNGLPINNAYEVYGGTAGNFAESTAAKFTVNHKLQNDKFTGTATDWLSNGDLIEFRMAMYQHTGMDGTVDIGDGTTSDTQVDIGRAGNGLARWSSEGDPRTASARTVGSGEKIFWLASSHPNYTMGAGTKDINVQFAGIPANKYMHAVGGSVHKLNSDGSLAQGIGFNCLSVSSAGTDMLSTSHNAAATKRFADTELLAWLNGITWEQTKPLIVMMNIADTESAATWATLLNGSTDPGGDGSSAEVVGFLARLRWACEQIGRPVHFVLVNNEAHELSDDPDLFSIKADHDATETGFRNAADSNGDVTVWSRYRYHGGMTPWEFSSVVKLDDNGTTYYSTAGYPHREGRCLIEYYLPTVRGVTISGSPTTLLDSNGLHPPQGFTGDSVLTWQNVLIQEISDTLPVGGGMRDRGRGRQR